jgi:formate/nitrite transporter FocA (FNT family)
MGMTRKLFIQNSVGAQKSEMTILKTFMLAVLAGAFIALGAIFATSVSAVGMSVTASDGSVAYTTALPYGMAG